MYRIVTSDGAVLYDTNDPDAYMMREPLCKMAIGQPGALEFSIYPNHPEYENVKSMETFVSAYKENEEIFYGRVVNVNVDAVKGIKKVTCAGALQFLDDSELPAMDSEGETLTGEAFFEKCINAHNSDMNGDAKKTLGIGTVSHAKASTERLYKITSYTKVKQALDSNLINDYGGYLRVRNVNGTHVVDWVEQYVASNDSPIEVAYNIISQDNAFNAADLFTVLRPTGKDGVALTEGTVEVSSELVAKYGRIVRSISFKDAETEEDLRSETEYYINRIGKGIGKASTIKLVDMHIMDDRYSAIQLGGVYTNIQGFEGENMIVSDITYHFANPAEDEITLKNQKELSGTINGTTTSSASSSITKKVYNNNTTIQDLSKHIYEIGDTLYITGERIIVTMKEYQRLATYWQDEWGYLHGTGVLQNSDQITHVAGMFRFCYTPVPERKLRDPNRNPNACGWYEKHQYQFQESDLGSGIELYASEDDARRGEAISTGISDNVGTWFIKFEFSSDSRTISGKAYYIKGMYTKSGTEVYMDEDGHQVNVGEWMDERKDEFDNWHEEVEGSALWTMRNNITAVSGKFDIVTDAQGNETLVVLDGSAFKLRKEGTEYGLWSEDNLTAGVMIGKISESNEKLPFKNLDSNVDTYTALGLYSEDTLTAGVLIEKLSDGVTKTKILGDYVDITASQKAEIALYTEDHMDGGFIVRKINEQGQTYSRILSTYVDITADDFARIGTYVNNHLDAGGIVAAVNDTTLQFLPKNIAANAEAVAAWGAYTNDNLIGGILVQKLNDGTATTQIAGSIVDISANQVKIGETSNVEAKFGTVDGLLADKATIGELQALSARIEEIDANYISSALADLQNVSVQNLTASAAVEARWFRFPGQSGFTKVIKDAAVNQSTNTLTLTFSDGSTVDFSKATSKISGSWSGTTYTAAPDPNGAASASTSVSVSVTGSGNQINVAAFHDTPITANQIYGKAVTLTEDAANKVVKATRDGTQIASVSTATTWGNGKSEGYASAHVTRSWSGAKCTVTKTTSSSAGNSFTMNAEAKITYSSSTHKYTASAVVDGESRATVTGGTQAYNAGKTDGYAGAHVTRSWDGAVCTVEKTDDSTKGDSFTMTASATISYNSTTHKYLARASIDGGSRATKSSGIEAYNDGIDSVTPKIYDANGDELSTYTLGYGERKGIWAGTVMSDGETINWSGDYYVVGPPQPPTYRSAGYRYWYFYDPTQDPDPIPWGEMELYRRVN